MSESSPEYGSAMIEILVVRDPDSADDITVYRDGIDVTNESDLISIVYVDAGAGYSYDDWCENTFGQLGRENMTRPFYQRAKAAFDDPPGKKYIDGWPEEDR